MNFLIPLFIFFGTPAFAGVPCTLPFTPPAALVAGQVADPSQLVANYNALVTCLGNAAAAGANSDITSLSALTSLSPQQGGTPVFIGSNTSTGTANAQVVTPTLPSTFSLTSNFKVIFKAGFTNLPGLTAGHNTTLQVGSTVVTPVFRPTTGGPVELAGGEIIAGTITEAVFDGTQFQLMSNVSPFPVGTVLETVGATSDPGFLFLDGSCQSTTTFATLWVRLGSPVPGGCAGGQFALPNATGQFILTPGGGTGIFASLLGIGGSSTVNLVQNQLPNYTLTGGTGQAKFNVASNVAVTGAGSFTQNVASTGNTTSDAGALINVQIPSGGSGAAVILTNPYLALNRQIKY